ncbi:MAG: methionine--tRNA ligase [Nanoarchaeota archaeon]|nr:methionine--tRNA ligase [Nanoarchaeota archaeon]
MNSNNAKSKDTFFITTAIDYATGTPHIGHAYEKIASDVIARFQRLNEKKVFFLTGTDEHGQKVFEKAQENNQEVQEFVDEQTHKFLELTKTLNLSNDFFIRTTQIQHKQFVQQMLQRAYDNCDIYLDEYEGLYCVGCEKYYGEDELLEENGVQNMCPIHKTQCRSVKQENYFFRLSKYEDFLLNYYEQNPEFLSPKHRREEIINRVKAGLRDVSISRPKENLTWGIEFPFDSSHVTYVWFDALFNYLSATNYKELSQFANHWPANVHIIGADISWFHMVYWPAFLHSCGYELPKTVHAHGMILDKDGHKMSKSLGNVVNPLDEIEEFGLDEFRYYIMSLGSFGEDCRYSHEDFEQVIINDLNNDLGNLVSRVYTMVQKYTNGLTKVIDKNQLQDIDVKLFKKLNITSEFEELINQFEIHKAMQLVWSRIRELNAYINQTEPFKVENEARRVMIMNVLVNSLYNLAPYISVIMPQKAELLAKQLGFEVKEDLQFNLLEKEITLKDKVQLFSKEIKNIAQREDNISNSGSNLNTVSNNENKKKDINLTQKNSITIADEKRVEIKAILFDFDGVLIENYQQIYDANNSAYSISQEKFKDLFDGNPITGFKEQFSKEQIKEFYNIFDEVVKDMQVTKKVKKELFELQKKYQLFCVTSNTKNNIDLILQNSGLDTTLFQETLCGDFNSCKEFKINCILEKYNLQKDEVIFVTDTLGDLKEANRAGVKSIAVDFGFHEQERLKKGAPYKIVSSFKQIRREVDSLNKHTISNISIKFSEKLHSTSISARLHTLHPTQKNVKIALFVHGFCATKFGCKSEEFKWHLISQGYDFLSFDFLGCGENEQYPLSITSQLKQVEELLEILTTQRGYEEVVLIGHSLGGYNVLSQTHQSITKKIAIAPLCVQRTQQEMIERLQLNEKQLQDLKENKQCEFSDNQGESVHMLSKQLFSDFTQISTKKLQKIANSSKFQTLVLQAQKDPIILQKYVDSFVEGCEGSKVKYVTIKRGTHSFKHNTQEENEFFFNEIAQFIENGIEEPPLEFSDLCLQVGTIISVENHPDADSLYVEQVDFGEFGIRQIVSGLKKYFTKEEMVGKQVLAVTNLQTAKLRGVDSQGMLLLAENKEGKLSFIIPEQNVENGSYICIEKEGGTMSVANNSKSITVDEFFKHQLQAVEGGVEYIYTNTSTYNKSFLNVFSKSKNNISTKLISQDLVFGVIR